MLNNLIFFKFSFYCDLFIFFVLKKKNQNPNTFTPLLPHSRPTTTFTSPELPTNITSQPTLSHTSLQLHLLPQEIEHIEAIRLESENGDFKLIERERESCREDEEREN